MKTRNHIVAALTAVAGMAGVVEVAGAQVHSFHLLGSLPGSNTYSSGYGVSEDGSVVVGHSGNNYYYGSSSHAFRWSDDTGIVDLDPLAPAAGAFAISGDGLIIAGSETSGSVKAVEWNGNSSSVTDQLFHGGEVFGLSRDGLVAVGYDLASGGGQRNSGPHIAAKYEPGNSGGHLVTIDTPGTGVPAPSASECLGANADGSVIVGWGVFNGVRLPFRWTSATNMVTLGSSFGTATGVSADGTTVVGGLGQISHAFRWTSATGMVDLGVLPGTTMSVAYAANADGSVVVGMSGNASGLVQRAFVWTPDAGMRDLNTVLAGVVPSGFVLTEARAINSTGTVIAGGSRTPAGGVEAWVDVSTPPATCTPDFNGDGDIGTDADIEAFFACLAGNCCATCGSADFNGDGDVGTDADIEAFFRVLAGGSC